MPDMDNDGDVTRALSGSQRCTERDRLVGTRPVTSGGSAVRMVGFACLACCVPPIVAAAGISTGAVAGAGVWLGRNAALLATGGAGLAGVAALARSVAAAAAQPTAPRKGRQP